MNVLLKKASFANLTEVIKVLPSLSGCRIAGKISNVENKVQWYSQEVDTDKTDSQKTISKAMKAYLVRAKAHDEFMSKERQDFEIGKRHLANMMGEDPETFTQEDVDRAIEYLFPSGLYDKKARPMMKPPEDIYPQRKAAEFDEKGRPFHFLFYTARPHYYEVLHNIVQHINDLYQFEDVMLRKGLQPDPNLKLDFSGYQWLNKDALEEKLVETIQDKEYDNFLNAIQRLSAMPYSYRFKDFIYSYCSPLIKQLREAEIPKPKYDAEGRAYVTTYECARKRAKGDVTVRLPGTGKITINGQDITYFEGKQEREQLLFPLIFCNMEKKVDIECNVQGGGFSAQAGAMRFGIAMSLRSFVDDDTLEEMRLAGLLTRDIRTKERKKPGQEGARRKFTWNKR